MKKILFLSLFISFNTFGQSILLSPSTISKQNSSLDDIIIQSYATYPSIIGLRANGTITSPTALASDDIIMQLGVRGYTGAGFSTSRANIRFKTTQAWTNTANGTSITFETTPNNSTNRTERMVINQDGYVGIGTTPSAYILDINGRSRIRHNVSTAGLWFNKSDNTEGAFTGMYDNNIYGFFGMGAVSNWKFAFDLVNTKMGIGTLTPKHPITFPNTVGDKISFWGGNTLATDSHYGIGIQGYAFQFYVPETTDNLVFGVGRSAAFSEKMRIEGSGNVGIGINNPTSTLAVVRGTGVNGTAAFYGTTWTSHFNYATTEDTYIRGGKNNSKVLINDLIGLGNVGIGTATPNYKLQVNTIGNSAGIVHANNIGIQVGTYVGSGAGWYGTLSNHPLAFFVNNGGPAVILTTSEQLQVGGATTPAGFKMSVDGKVICTEMEVLVTPWPDYVFKPNYKLKPIQEIERFIIKNGHLPNIPKAEDIETKSLALGNMAKLQMEKIEELTLYLIEINKRLEKIENENMVLKAELKTIKSQN
jgi:hypothetical protein